MRPLPWMIVQVLVWGLGIVIVMALVLWPPLGRAMFWNGLIPAAPAVFVLTASFWRNVCPLSTTSLLPDRFTLAKTKRTLTAGQQQRVLLAGTVLLFVIVPLRHALFDDDGPATGFLLLGAATAAIVLGFIFERKSIWCSGLCPIHPVEKLYGGRVAFSVPNLHCIDCVSCALPCPDSLVGNEGGVPRSLASKLNRILMAGAFPGYVWGWFQQRDYAGVTGFAHLGAIYLYPVASGLVTATVYATLGRLVPAHEKVVRSAFAAAAVSCYYVYRLPQLFGWNPMHSDDALVLVDLRGHLPAWSMVGLTSATTVFFVWWIVVRGPSRTRWSRRPPYARRMRNDGAGAPRLAVTGELD